MKIRFASAATIAGAALLAVSLATNAVLLWPRCQPAATAVPNTPAAVSTPTGNSYLNFITYRNAVELRLSAEMPLEQLEKCIKITPEVPFRLRSVWYDARYYTIEADWTPESFYRLQVILPPGDDGVAREPLELSFVTSERDPLIAGATEGTFFPLNGKLWELPLKIRNVSSIRASLDSVYANNLAEWRYDGGKTRPVAEKNYPVKPARNAVEAWTLPLSDLLPERRPGLYVLTLSSESGSCYSRQMLVITDLGVQAALSGSQALVAIRSLTDGKPVADAELTLVSRKNQTLAQGYSDEQGQAVLEFSLADDPDDEPRLIVVSHGEDRAFLDSFDSDSRLDLSKFATEGAPEPAAEQAVRALLHTERGILRPGETMHCFLQLRDKNDLTLPPAQPVEIELRDPDYRVVQRVTVTTDAYGTAATAFTLPADAETGYYELQAGLPGAKTPPWTSCSFLVSHFTPDQFKIAITAAPAESGVNDPIEVSGSVRYYFDEPLRDREVTLMSEYSYEPFNSESGRGYTFGVLTEPRAPERERQMTSTGPEGDFQAVIPVPAPLPDLPLPNMPLRIRATASVTGANGRTVSSGADVVRHANPWYLGLRRDGDDARFEWLAVKPDGKAAAVATPLRYELQERRWNYVTREVGSSWKRVWNEELIPAGQGEIAAAGLSGGAFEPAFDHPGAYRLRVTDPATGVAAELDFYYWYGDGGGIRSANPSVLTFSTDRDTYLPGHIALVEFTLPSAGLVLTAAETSEAGSLRTFSGKAGENTIPVLIPAGFTGGTWYAGITVLLHDPERAKEPQRLFGLLRLTVDQSGHRLNVALDTPASSRPGRSETIQVTLADAAGAPVQGKVQLWAVDTGILALMNWDVPDTFRRFYGARENTLRFFDTYSQLYPALRVLPDGQIGGDGKAGMRLRRLGTSTEVDASAVVILPAVETDAAGRATVPVTWPIHTGSMRLMATAISPNGVGTAAREITLRHPAGIRVTVPAAVAPGDEFEVTVEVFNHDFETLDARWQLKSVGGIVPVAEAAAENIQLSKHGQAVFKRRYRAGAAPGAAGVVAQLQTADGHHWDDRAGFTVRPMTSYGTRTEAHVLAPGKSLTLTVAAGDWLPGSLKRKMEAGGSPAARLTGCLEWLNSYPYGCAEQTAATAFPFLGIPALVKNGLIPEHFLAQRDRTVREALRRLSGMRNGFGSFGMWPGGDGEWTDLTLFVSHFLLEAAADGYPVDADLRRELEYRLSRNATDKGLSMVQRAYANYLCALAGKPAAGVAEELLATNQGDPLADFLAAAGLMKSGRAKAGMERLDQCLQQQPWLDNRPAECNWYRPAARLGMMLWITMELAPEHPQVHAMAQQLAALLDTDRFSTQENAWAALGLSRWSAVYGVAEGAGKIAFADGAVREFSGREPYCTDLPETPVTLTNTGAGNLYITIFTGGVPAQAKAEANGLSVSRRYLDEAGNEIAEAAVGQLLTVEVTLAGTVIDSLVLTDLLPGGVAIEDERLASRYIPVNAHEREKNSSLQVRLLEKGADRLLLFGDHTGPEPAVFTYRVRAVTPGRYQLPPVEVEAMYQPQIRACSVFDGKALTIR